MTPLVAAIGAALAAVTLKAPFGTFEIAETSFPERDFVITDFGAKPGGAKCTEAFAAAMDACERAGGGRVVVPSGKWLTGAVQFRNNCNLHINEGATLEFTDDPSDYPEAFTTWEGVECWNHSPLLYAFGVTNVAITGSGTIAPRMDLWREWFKRTPEHMAATEHLYYWCSTNAPTAARRLLSLDRAHMRPHLIQFNRCGRILLDGFRIRESPFWMIHLYHSGDCIVRNLDTYAHGHNNDGVDIDMTKRVLVENCRFDQGDDGIVLKAGRNADGWRLDRCTENVVVRDCDLVDCHSLLGIGSELSGGVRNVWMTRCTVRDTYSMLRLKTGPRRGGFIENVYMDSCRGWRMIRVFDIFTQYYAQWRRFPDFELRRTRIRNVNISDCEAELASWGLQLEGDEALPPETIRVRNVKVGRVFTALADVRNCEDVKIDGLSLGRSGDFPFEPRRFVASGVSAEAYAGDGSWSKLIRQVKPGDEVVIDFPPSPAADEFVRHVQDQGGKATVVPLRRDKGVLRLICKQGYHGEDAPGVPGNSAEAFRLAWKNGAKMVETDCWMIKSGRIVLMHDPKVLKRLSGEWHPSIGDLTDDDVARIDVGREAKSKTPVRMAYLEELFASMPKDAIAQCELCGYSDTFADVFDALRSSAGLSETNIVISGGSIAKLSDFKRRYPKYRTLWLTSKFLDEKDISGAIGGVIDRAKAAGVDIVCPRAAKALEVGLSPACADRFRAAGLEFRMWGVNTPELLEYAMRLGVPAATCAKWSQAFEWAKDIPGLEVTP